VPPNCPICNGETQRDEIEVEGYSLFVEYCPFCDQYGYVIVEATSKTKAAAEGLRQVNAGEVEVEWGPSDEPPEIHVDDVD